MYYSSVKFVLIISLEMCIVYRLIYTYQTTFLKYKDKSGKEISFDFFVGFTNSIRYPL